MPQPPDNPLPHDAVLDPRGRHQEGGALHTTTGRLWSHCARGCPPRASASRTHPPSHQRSHKARRSSGQLSLLRAPRLLGGDDEPAGGRPTQRLVRRAAGELLLLAELEVLAPLKHELLLRLALLALQADGDLLRGLRLRKRIT